MSLSRVRPHSRRSTVAFVLTVLLGSALSDLGCDNVDDKTVAGLPSDWADKPNLSTPDGETGDSAGNPDRWSDSPEYGKSSSSGGANSGKSSSSSGKSSSSTTDGGSATTSSQPSAQSKGGYSATEESTYPRGGSGYGGKSFVAKGGNSGRGGNSAFGGSGAVLMGGSSAKGGASGIDSTTVLPWLSSYCSDETYIGTSSWCDGYEDCNSGEDENSSICEAKCSYDGGFLCTESSECLLTSYRDPMYATYGSYPICDGYDDCSNGADEAIDCAAFCNVVSGFHCVESNECLKSDYQCDGIEDCMDGSDESGCVYK